MASATSAAFKELRVGDACLGPDLPACSSRCADTDLDGLNDAWEIAGGVDLNGDGRITDSYHDVLLPGADPNRPDIYLKYDYMVAPTHSHQPPAKAWEQMKAMFAAHGIALHVMAPQGGIPEHQVTTLDPNAQPNCAGSDFITMQQLRAQYFGNLRPAYHYMVFAHDSTTPGDGSLRMHCPADALCGAQPLATATGIADLPGADSIISFGHNIDSRAPVSIELWSSVMMHELGHNFGLVHGSLADPGNAEQACMNYKPNYISVMNYDYELNGLIPANAPGSVTPIACHTDADCGPPNVRSGRCAKENSCFCTDDLGPGNNVCYRPDYAEDNLISLNEAGLDERIGVAGPPWLEDIVWYNFNGGTGGPKQRQPKCGPAGRAEWVDSDQDGLSDAAEKQGYIDLNANGVFDSGIDVPLIIDGPPDPQKPDAYLHYDYFYNDGSCAPAGVVPYQNDIAAGGPASIPAASAGRQASAKTGPPRDARGSYR